MSILANVNCLFCTIVSGEAPASVVLDSPDAVGFLDHFPIFPGHVLVVPRPHVPTLSDLDATAIGPLFAQVQRVAAALPEALGCQGTWVSMNNVVSQSVPHLHVHIVPRARKDGLKGFYWPRMRYSSVEEMAEVARRIASVIGAG